MTLKLSTLMSKRRLRVVALLLPLAASGCSVFANLSPNGTLNEALRVSRREKTETLKGLLGDKILREYDSPEKLALLSQLLGSIVRTTPLKEVAVSAACAAKDPTRRNFVSVATAHDVRGKLVQYELDVACRKELVHEHTDYSPGICTLDPNDPGGPDICAPDTPESDDDFLMPDCRLSSVKTLG
jgi:hypothetical protein